MKNIYIIQNSNLSFDMDMSKIYSPEKYSLFLIVNKFGMTKLRNRTQECYFEKIWETENFEFDQLKAIISLNQKNNNKPLKIVTNAEEAVTVCGNLRVFFNCDTANYDRFINKITMKTLLKSHTLLTPKHLLFNKDEYKNNFAKYIVKIIENLSFPLIAKPIDSMSCMGIQKLHSMEELTKWCKKAIKTNSTYEIDEYINGKVYNCDSYIKNRKIVFTQVSECSNSCYDFVCGLTKGTIALPPNNFTYKLLAEYTAKVHDAINIPEGGVTHLEVIITEKNELYFVEIGHRSPGILIPAMYRKFLNIDTIESHILLQINEDHHLDINYGPYCAWIAFPIKSGKLIKKYIPSIQSEFTLEWNYQIGNILSDVNCGRDYAGRVLLWNNNYQQLKNDFYYLNSHQFFDVENARSTVEN